MRFIILLLTAFLCSLCASSENYVDADFGFIGQDPTTPITVSVELNGDNNSVGDFIWIDEDADGVQDADEIGLSGVFVALTYPDGSGMTTLSDQSGHYIFENLPSGHYTVSVEGAPVQIATPNWDADYLEAESEYIPSQYIALVSDCPTIEEIDYCGVPTQAYTYDFYINEEIYANTPNGCAVFGGDGDVISWLYDFISITGIDSRILAAELAAVANSGVVGISTQTIAPLSNYFSISTNAPLDSIFLDLSIFGYGDNVSYVLPDCGFEADTGSIGAEATTPSIEEKNIYVLGSYYAPDTKVFLYQFYDVTYLGILSEILDSDKIEFPNKDVLYKFVAP